MSKQKRIPMHREIYGSRAMKLPPLAAFDFETRGLGGAFIIAAITTSDNERVLFHTLDDFFEWVLSHPHYRYLAHNAVGYEFSYLYPLVYHYVTSSPGVTVIPTIQGDTRVVQLRITREEAYTTRAGKPAKTTIDLRDTLCLFNMSLKKVAEAFCPELPKLVGTIDFEHEDFNPQNPEHVEYVFRDCDIIIAAYTRLATVTQEVFGSPLGVTAGSTAMKAFKALIPEGHVYWRLNNDADTFIRRAYYGGMVLPGHHVGDWGSIASLDVNAAYAFQMANHPFPVGSPARTHVFERGDIGFYHVLVTVPVDCFMRYGFNPIPRRTDSGIDWPSGTFDTYISSVEIEFAESMGCSFEVLGGWVFSRYEPVFRNFCELCQRIELGQPDKKPTVKLYRNALYGKFGQGLTHLSMMYSMETQYDMEPVINSEATSVINSRIPGLWVKEEVSDSDYMLPHWAALVTAYERVYLMKYVKEAYERGATNVYTDTDSIKSDSVVILDMVRDETVPVGKNYGQFKLEELTEHFIVLGPKCFVGFSNDSENVTMKAKGIPNNKLSKKEYVEGLLALGRPVAKTKKARENEKFREVPFVSVKSLMSIIKENSSVRPIHRKRKITDLRNSASWEVDQWGRIFPTNFLAEYEKQFGTTYPPSPINYLTNKMEEWYNVDTATGIKITA